ncbi:hypothetical protein [Nocardioides sp. R-C-SC26]|uniref:hypothetical protein n=1 Tax=Nocardioides sp. R-C-SC26 TaxID=2870414 RepID=UPI001E5DF417|nr:hypothetical protein [Nocardioides sp. R-C-SC26]
MTWKSFHNRGEILRSVITAANDRVDGRLPMDLEGVAETFGDELTLLGALQLKWHTRLSGAIERELMHQPMDLESAVCDAWNVTADELLGVRAILDHYRANPTSDEMAWAMARSTAKERCFLATMAGLAGFGVVEEVGAAAMGARLEQRARARRLRVPSLEAGRSVTEPRPTFLERLRQVLAA